MNRIIAIGILEDKNERFKAYRRLYDSIYQFKSPFLIEEIETLLSLQKKETDRFCRALIWRNLLCAQAHEKLKEKALCLLQKTKDYERYYAIGYLLHRYPQMFNDLWNNYHNDSDPNVRYMLAENLLYTDQDKALSMMLEILPKAQKIIGNHEVCDAIELIILESNKEQYIQLLKELNKKGKKKTIKKIKHG